MNIYQPYTYSVYCIPTGQFYYGVQYGKNANPTNIGTCYFTSSGFVRGLIKKYGKHNFIFRVRKIFRSKSEAVSWERKVINRLSKSKKYSSKETFLNYTRSVTPPKKIPPKYGIHDLRAELFDLAIKLQKLQDSFDMR